jgi:DNA repair protein RecN (Recombination protein N)
VLTKLTISNFAIIKHIVFEPVAGLNIITGETGAGKSIILDALGLILGQRADVKTHSEFGEKCVVEGEFTIDAPSYSELFKQLDLDFEPVCIIRREILKSGKTRTFVNDTPVTLGQLKRITNSLVAIHSQHENNQLTESAFQFQLLDQFSNALELRLAYQNALHTYKIQVQALEQLKEQQSQLLKEKDYLSFLLNEFEALALKSDEEKNIEQSLAILQNSETLTAFLQDTVNTISEGEYSVLQSLNQIKNKYRSAETIHPNVKAVIDRLQSVIIELKDIVSETESLNELAQHDPVKMDELNTRLNSIQQLKRKHGVEHSNDLLSIHATIADQLLSIGNIDQSLLDLSAQVQKSLVLLKTSARALHQNRSKHLAALQGAIEEQLHTLEMPHAKIQFNLTLTEQMNEWGMDDLDVCFTANLGMPLQSIAKVASGGELSRLALSIRAIEAAHHQLNTLVFDEIDTGVSGKVADTIGQVFKQIALSHQVFAITHLPQVAGYGDAHFFVGKTENDQKTESTIQRLTNKQRIDELAKMLSGNQATEIAKKNAKELLKV